MRLLILIALALLFAGPFRRVYFRNFAFTIPATLAAVAGFLFGSWIISFGTWHPTVALLVPLMFAVGAGAIAGEAALAWWHRVFGTGDQRGDRPRT